MSDKVTLPSVASGYNLSVINSNFQTIEDVLNTSVLFRDEDVSNEMSVDLDMNGNSIYNVENIDSQQVTVAGVPLAEHIAALAIDIDPANVTVARHLVTIAVPTLIVSLPGTYGGSSSSIIVFKNGVQQPSTHYTFDGTNVTFSSLLEVGDVIDVVYFKAVVSALDGATIADIDGLQSALDSKQPNLVSGFNIRTINGENILGGGNLVIAGSGGGTVTSVNATVPTGLSVSGVPITSSGTIAITAQSGYEIPTTAKQTQWDSAYSWGNHALAGYQVQLVSGTNIKTVNGNSLLGSGDLVVSSGGGDPGLVLLAEVVLSNNANVVFNNSVLTSTYSEYEIHFDDVFAPSSGVLTLQASVNNGSTFITTYGYTGNTTDNLGQIAAIGQVTAGGHILLQSNAMNATASVGGLNGVLKLWNIAKTNRRLKIHSITSYSRLITDNFEQVTVVGQTPADTNINCIRIQNSNAINLQSGAIRLYGYRKSV